MLHKLYLGLWFATPVFDILLLIVLFVRRRATSFPIFTTCVAVDAVVYTVLLIAGHHRSSYFYKIFWPLDFTLQAMSLLLAYEISIHVFRPTGVWASDVRKPLIGIAGTGILVAFLIALLAHPALHPHLSLMWRISLFPAILAKVLFVGMLALSSIVGLPWKTHAARIAQVICILGLFNLLIEIVTNSASSAHLNRIYIPLMCIQMIVGLAGMVYWLVVLWRDEPAPKKLPEHMRNQICTLQQQAENHLTNIRLWKNPRK